MSIESAIEEKIREAIERGDFDNLEGKGKPLNLDAYFNTPEDLRMAYAMLRSNEFVPREVEILNEIGQLKEKLALSRDEEEQSSLKLQIEKKNLEVRLSLESRNRKR